ncbi:MAG: hypothetical protein R3Y56_05725 [Akkermansia sp.]
MKTTTFMATIALLGMQAFAVADTTTPTTSPSDSKCPATCCTPDQSCCPTMSPDGKVQSFGQEWLNLETVTIEAANGDPIAQYTLAYLTDTGNQVPQDKEKAAQMYASAKPGLEKAAQAGHAAACQALAHMCATGTGCDKDPEQAKKYAKMAKDCCKGDTTPACTPAQ